MGVIGSVCDSLILLSTVRVNTGVPVIETDSGHLLPVLPLAQRRVKHTRRRATAPRWLAGMGHDALGTIP